MHLLDMLKKNWSELWEASKWLLASLTIASIGIVILFFHTQIEIETWKVFFREFGVALIIAGIVSFVYEYFLRFGLVELIIEKLHIDKSITDAGIKSIYSPKKIDPRSDFEKILYFLDNTTQKIKLLGITADFYFKYGPASPSYDRLIHLLDSGCEIQVLMLNPDPTKEEKEKGMTIPFSVLSRAEAEKDNPKDLQRKIRESFNSKFSLKEKYGDLLKIRFYDSPPLCAMTVLDRNMKVTPYLFGTLGLESPTFEIENNERRPTCLFRVYEQHFDLLWESGIELEEPFDLNK